MIRFSSELKYIPGFVHGLQHPGVNGMVELDPGAALNAEHRAALSRFLEIEEITWNSAHSEPGASIHFVLSALVKWQQRQRIITPDSFYLSPPLGTQGAERFQFVLPYSLPLNLMSATLSWMARLVAALGAAGPGNAAAQIQELKPQFTGFTDTLQPYMAASVNRFLLADAAFRLGIPIAPKRGDIYQLGTGCFRRLVSSSITDSTPAISVSIARNKVITADILRQAGMPAPQHMVARDPDQAIAQATQLGYPVVIKPADQEEGKGVAAGLEDQESVRQAFDKAASLSRQVLVEKHVPGSTHRLTVFQGAVIKVVKRIAGGVTGDGRHSIAELVDLAQSERKMQLLRRRHGGPVLTLDQEAIELLQRQGLSAEHIPQLGQYVRLRRRDNSSAGGRNEAVRLDGVHEDNLELAVRAAALLELDFAGIDLIIDDISSSWLERQAVICEVNAQPTLGAGDEPEIYLDILQGIMAKGARVPVHLVIVLPDAQFSHEDAQALRTRLGMQGLASKTGLWLEQCRVGGPAADGFNASRALLNNPDVQSALCVMEFNEVATMGLPLDRFDSILIAGTSGSGNQQQIEAVLAGIAAHANATSYI